MTFERKIAVSFLSFLQRYDKPPPPFFFVQVDSYREQIENQMKTIEEQKKMIEELTRAHQSSQQLIADLSVDNRELHETEALSIEAVTSLQQRLESVVARNHERYVELSVSLLIFCLFIGGKKRESISLEMRKVFEICFCKGKKFLSIFDFMIA